MEPREFQGDNITFKDTYYDMSVQTQILLFPQINFGFCKGDDNYGGVKRKEIDDFLKSLGKTYNLVLYRMQVQGVSLNPDYLFIGRTLKT